MRPSILPSVLPLLLAACAAPRVSPPPSEAPGPASVVQQAELARVRCLLVAPLENGSNLPGLASDTTSLLLASVAPARARVLPIEELRAVFADTPLELPEGIPTSTALELAELLGADAALHGSVEGRGRDAGAVLVVSLRLTLAGSRDLLYAADVRVETGPGEPVEAAVKRAVRERVRPVLDRLGGPSGAPCFPAARREALRAAAVALRSSPPVRSPAPAAPVAPATRHAEPGATAAERNGRGTLHTARQREWARLLATGGRLALEDVAFTGRTAELAREGGLADLAVVLAASPGLTIRLEGFVDATADRAADVKLSLAMAQSARRRLTELGAEPGRVEAGGRGGENPVLPNFTARGRSANRRLEAVASR